MASTLLGIINSSDTSPSKSDKIKGILSTFGTKEINIDAIIDGSMKLREAISISYGNFINQESAINFFKKYIRSDIADSIFVKNVVTYSMKQFYEAVTFATLYEGSISSQRIQEYTSTLVTRLQALQDGIQGHILAETSFKSIEEYVDDILGNNQIVNIDISMLDDASAEVVTKVLAKLLLDYLKKLSQKRICR